MKEWKHSGMKFSCGRGLVPSHNPLNWKEEGQHINYLSLINQLIHQSSTNFNCWLMDGVDWLVFSLKVKWMTAAPMNEEERRNEVNCWPQGPTSSLRSNNQQFNHKLSEWIDWFCFGLPRSCCCLVRHSVHSASNRQRHQKSNQWNWCWFVDWLVAVFISLHSLLVAFFLHWFHCWFLVWFSSLGGAIGAASAHNPPIKDKPKPTFINCGSSRALLKFHSSISNAAWGRSARQLFLYFFFQLIRKSWKEKK